MQFLQRDRRLIIAAAISLTHASGYYAGDRQGSPFRSYDVAADGRRFLMLKESTPPNQNANTPPIIVVQNWFEELKRLVPAR